MRRARVILVLIFIAGLAGGVLARFTPTVYYKPAYEGGECTVAFTPYHSLSPDTWNSTLQGKRVPLATVPGTCKTFVIIGD